MPKVPSLSSANFAASPIVRILGIDPGYDRIGWAVLEQNTRGEKRLIGYGLITTPRDKSSYERYQIIDTDLNQVLDHYQPHFVAMENLFFQSNQKTVMKVSEARGVIMSCFFRRQLPLAEYTPLQVKLGVTGHGRADKQGVEKMVRLELNLSEKIKIIDDTLDAMAVALTHSATLNLSR